jgi:head-tail adaptor
MHKKLCIKAHKCTDEWERPRKLTARIVANAREIVQEKAESMICTENCAKKYQRRTKICANSRLQVAYVKCKRKQRIFLDGEVFLPSCLPADLLEGLAH